MKYRELPKLIREGSWCCDFGFDGLVKEIEEMKTDKEVYEKVLDMNPDFQRGHVWNEEQQIKYIEAVLVDGAKHARTIYLNCPDWNFNNKTDYHDFTCIDGLQRYTAIKRFVNNEIPAFGTLYKDFEDHKYLSKQFFFKLNINNLKSREEVLRWYLQVNDGGTPHTKEEIERVKKLLEKEINK